MSPTPMIPPQGIFLPSHSTVQSLLPCICMLPFSLPKSHSEPPAFLWEGILVNDDQKQPGREEANMKVQPTQTQVAVEKNDIHEKCV